MKIVILVEILLISLANTSAQKTITCQVYSPRSSPGCSFSEITIGPNETVSIKTDPEDYDANKIVSVGIGWSTIHSVPREIFTKSFFCSWSENSGDQTRHFQGCKEIGIQFGTQQIELSASRYLPG
jgi:hypothetical protein